MFRVRSSFLLCQALASATTTSSTTTSSSSTSPSSFSMPQGHQDQQHEHQEQEQEQKKEVFASGYAIKPTVAAMIRLALSQKNKKYKSNVYFTASQLKMMRIKLKQGQEPIVLENLAQGGLMKVNKLVLYNADQTVNENFVPDFVRKSRDSFYQENHNNNNNNNNKNNNKNHHNQQQRNNNNNNNNNNSYQKDNQVAVNEDIVVNPSSSTSPSTSTALSGSSFLNASPHFYGGISSWSEHSSQRQIPKSIWPTLSSVAAMMKFNSSTWYSRSAMRNAALKPKSDGDLPIVVRIYNPSFRNNGANHHQNNNNSNNNTNNQESSQSPAAATSPVVFQHLFNACQLETALLQEEVPLLRQEEEESEEEGERGDNKDLFQNDNDPDDLPSAASASASENEHEHEQNNHKTNKQQEEKGFILEKLRETTFMGQKGFFVDEEDVLVNINRELNPEEDENNQFGFFNDFKSNSEEKEVSLAA